MSLRNELRWLGRDFVIVQSLELLGIGETQIVSQWCSLYRTIVGCFVTKSYYHLSENRSFLHAVLSYRVKLAKSRARPADFPIVN
jgi:hypothetical protein